MTGLAGHSFAAGPGEETPPESVAAGGETNQSPGDAVLTTGKGIAKGVGEAGAEVGDALRTGGTSVATQTRSLWEETILPALQRTAGALPGLIKAVLLLIVFWIIGGLAGAGVSKLLGMTNLDNRAVREWGMEGLLEDKKGGKRSLEQLFGAAVKWIIVLFGFIAFFNALDLQLVAKPLENVLSEIVGVLPNILKAFVILLVYWAMASIVRVGITKGLGALKFDDRAARIFPPREVKGKMLGPSALLARLVFYVILFFGLTPFLEALGQETLVQPLQDMLAKGLAFLPNVVGAAVLLLVGNIVATILREITTNFLAAAGLDAGVAKLGFGKALGARKLSAITGSIVYFLVFIPILTAAVDSLQIKAISDPVTATLEKVLAAVPAVLLAAIIVAVGYAIARLVRGLVTTLLEGVGFDQLPEKTGLGFLKPKDGKSTLSSISGTVVMVIIMILTLQQALASLGLTQLADFAGWTIDYLPKLAVGLVILLAALAFGEYAGRLAASAASGSGYGKVGGTVAKYAIIVLGAGMALDQMGISRNIVTVAVTAVLGGAALALGLAFGLGGKEKAREIIENRRPS